MTTQNKLNPYTIYWFTLIPVNGIVPLSDQKIITGSKFFTSKGAKMISVHSPNKEAAIFKINALFGKLSKKYRVYLYTDKQYGMRNYNSELITILTEKQKNESFIIQ